MSARADVSGAPIGTHRETLVVGMILLLTVVHSVFRDIRRYFVSARPGQSSTADREGCEPDVLER